MRYKQMWLKLKSEIEDRKRICDAFAKIQYNTYGEVLYWRGKEEAIGVLDLVVKQIESEEKRSADEEL